MSHILVRVAQYRLDQKSELEGCHYSHERGAWIENSSGNFLVHSTSGSRPKPMTKKADMETGEDQK